MMVEKMVEMMVVVKVQKWVAMMVEKMVDSKVA